MSKPLAAVGAVAEQEWVTSTRNRTAANASVRRWTIHYLPQPLTLRILKPQGRLFKNRQSAYLIGRLAGSAKSLLERPQWLKKSTSYWQRRDSRVVLERRRAHGAVQEVPAADGARGRADESQQLHDALRPTATSGMTSSFSFMDGTHGTRETRCKVSSRGAEKNPHLRISPYHHNPPRCRLRMRKPGLSPHGAAAVLRRGFGHSSHLDSQHLAQIISQDVC